jgi:hypothetical protein
VKYFSQKLKIIMLGKIRQAQKDKSHIFAHMQYDMIIKGEPLGGLEEEGK